MDDFFAKLDETLLENCSANISPLYMTDGLTSLLWKKNFSKRKRL